MSEISGNACASFPSLQVSTGTLSCTKLISLLPPVSSVSLDVLHLNAVNVQNATTWKLTDLNPCTEYSISVKAKTAAVPITVSTLETGMFIYLAKHCMVLGNVFTILLSTQSEL